MATITQVTERPTSGLNHIDALLGNVPWNYLPGNTIKYSFALSAGGDPSGTLLNPATVTAFNAAQATHARGALAYIAGLTGIQFTEVGTSAEADVHFGNADLLDGYTSQNITRVSYTNQGGQAVGLDVEAWVYLDIFDDAYDNLAPSPGGVGYESLLHEMGHVLGLKHPSEGAQQLPVGDALGQDNTMTTLMSYAEIGDAHAEYSPYDLAALAWLYGGDGLQGNYGIGAPGKVLVGGVGNDLLQGGAGTDKAVYANAHSSYALAKSGAGFTVTANGETDTLAGIERVEFSDRSVNLTMGTVAATVSAGQLDSLVELYIAYLNRVPDADGMAFWIGKLAAGESLARIGEHFYATGVFFSDLTGYHADSTNAEFVDRVYDNVLGRDEPDAEGLAFWTHMLDSGSQTRASLVASVLDSAHALKGRGDFGWVADLLDNKIAVGKYAAIDNGLVYNTPEDSISQGVAIAAAVTPDSTAAAIALVGVSQNLDLLA